MEFKIKRSEFLETLSWTQSVVEKKTTMPILSNILLEAKGDQLKILATDLEIGIIAQMKGDILQEGKICVFGKNLYDIVKESPAEEIHLQKKDQNRLEVKSGRSQFKIVGFSAEEFPQLPVPEDKNFYVFEPKALSDMIQKTIFCIATDESRYNLHGIYIEPRENHQLRMVASDGHRLSFVDREVGQALKIKKGILVPKKGINEIRHLAGESLSDSSEENHPLALAFDGRNLIARRGGITIITRLIDGEFPDYQRVLPKVAGKHVSVERHALMGALKRVSLLISDRSRGVRFGFSPGLLELSVSSSDLGEAREEIEIDYKGDVFHAGFNARYFLDVLSALADEKVLLELNGEVGPCVVHSPTDPGFLSIVMPMRI